MYVVSVNVGNRSQLARLDGGKVETGIRKKAVQGVVVVSELGLQDDAICNTRHHGGPDQAVYLYRQEDYDFWSDELGDEVPAGTFGENLTLSGLTEAGLNVGDELSFRDLRLQVTAPRIPCTTLAARMRDKLFPKRFVRAERPGIYCRVLTPGTVGAGEEFSIDLYTGDRVSTVRMFRDVQRKLNPDEIIRYLDLPIDARTRTAFEKQLNTGS